ncbi:MAG: response regulator [Bdellovibrionota bacterium]|nr:response regulator [Bdellovibrionota bacterium]
MRILTIDDSETTRAKIKMTFEKYGHHVLEAKSGSHAHDILRHDTSFDLIICDMNMPDMDGAQFVKSQDEDEKLRKIPTVICSSHLEEKLADSLKAYSCVKGWLNKPVTEKKVKSLLFKFGDA